MNTDKIVWEYAKGLLNWYDFKPMSSILYVTEKENSIVELLQSNCAQLVLKDASDSLDGRFLTEYERAFDYIIAIGVVERLEEPSQALSKWKLLLNPEGKLLLGMNNRLGLKYFCGDRDPYTGRSFDGVEHYRRIQGTDWKSFKGRCYSRDEISEFLNNAGLTSRKFYSVLPSLEFPQLIYAEDYLPVEELSGRYFPMYYHPDSVFLEEEFLYCDMIQNGMFHATANSYLIECSLNQNFQDVKHVTLSMDRGEEYAMATVIFGKGIVEKRALYEAGAEKLKKLQKHHQDLQEHGLNVIEITFLNGICSMPFLPCETLVTYLRRVAKTDKEKFISEMDAFRELILQSSEIVSNEEEPGMGVRLKKGYLDLVPLNCFYDHGKFIFYDQEFCEENYLANVIIYRAIGAVYIGDLDMESILPMKYFFQRYHLVERMELWQKMAYHYIADLRNLRQLRPFFETCQRNVEVVHTNRQRMNYSSSEYQRIFVNIFSTLEDKKLLLFGSGNFARKFLARYQEEYPIHGIVDNNPEKWGTQMEGIPIHSIEWLKELSNEKLKVIICVKNYIGIVRQLRQIGINDYGVFDTNADYPKKRKDIVPAISMPNIKKKYHVGYIAGVFDLFHIGHLNMFERAKEQCDYLIVGVVTDEAVRKHKKTEPFIRFEERMAMVGACRYVDRVVKIPLHAGGTRDAYQMYGFDCQFSGSDYMDNPDWLADKVYLERQGADLVFFPYTETTSSSKLKRLIEKSLL